jgi:hypothetical protein
VAPPARRRHHADTRHEATKYLEENLAAAALTLSQAELDSIAAFLREFRTSGNSYGDAELALVRGERERLLRLGTTPSATLGRCPGASLATLPATLIGSDLTIFRRSDLSAHP